jgi:hypothetical protein
MLSELSNTDRETFLSCLKKASKTLISDPKQQSRLRRFGIQPKHLTEDRINKVKPCEQIYGGKVRLLSGFFFEIIRHPQNAVLRQKWWVSTTGQLRLMDQEGIDHQSRVNRQKKKFVHCSKLKPWRK